MKKYTEIVYHQKIQEVLPKSNFVFNFYDGAENPCSITCLACNKTYNFSKARLIKRRASRGNKNACKYCEENTWANQQKKAEYKAKNMLEKKQTIKLVGEIKTWASREEVEWHCDKCNHNFFRSPFVMFSQGSIKCPWCESHPYEYTEEMIRTQAQELWGNEYSILQVKNVERDKKNGSRRILVCHNRCGFKYNVNQYHFMQGTGCPRCKESHGERRVRKYLDKYNFKYQTQYSIYTKNKRWLKLDFYLEENNQKFAIEYNGIQHYTPIDWFNGEEGFRQQCIRDEEKRQYCIDNNIELIIIPYNNENIINTEELAQRLRGQATER